MLEPAGKIGNVFWEELKIASDFGLIKRFYQLISLVMHREHINKMTETNLMNKDGTGVQEIENIRSPLSPELTK